jgi:hypothetical protein
MPNKPYALCNNSRKAYAPRPEAHTGPKPANWKIHLKMIIEEIIIIGQFDGKLGKEFYS